MAYGPIQFSSVIQASDSFWPHKLQHTRFPFPSPTPSTYSNSCILNQWRHPTISSSVVPFSSCIQSSTRVFSKESVLHIRWPKYWSLSFSINPSNEYAGLISFRMDWLDLLAVQGILQSLLQYHKFKSINSLALSFLYNSHIHTWPLEKTWLWLDRTLLAK